MATWRQKAIESFPSLRQDLNDPEFSIYMLFFELLPMSREAHCRGETKLLDTIYGFAEWCANQKAGDLSNAAGVAFYEHLFDRPELWEKVVDRLSPQLVRACWPLWERRLEPDRLKELRKLLARKAPQ